MSSLVNFLDARALSAPRVSVCAVGSIGYEGRSIDQFLEILKTEEIDLVIDVRKNPISRKKGFSKLKLAGALNNFGISYQHLPGLGIPSDLRKTLKTKEDYEILFRYYQSDILPTQTASIDVIFELALRYRKVALTCFESDHQFCHRQYVVAELARRGCSVFHL